MFRRLSFAALVVAALVVAGSTSDVAADARPPAVSELDVADASGALNVPSHSEREREGLRVSLLLQACTSGSAGAFGFGPLKCEANPGTGRQRCGSCARLEL